MPQLDPVTFASQFFWLCIVFSALYLILVKFCLPNIARILKVREYMQTNSSTDAFDKIEAPTISSDNFAIAKKCFSSYPSLKFETKTLSDCNLGFYNDFATNYQNSVIANLILSKYGRASSRYFAQNSANTKNVTNASLVFYYKIVNQMK
jgi:hypothetical protein